MRLRFINGVGHETIGRTRTHIRAWLGIRLLGVFDFDYRLNRQYRYQKILIKYRNHWYVM